MRYSLLQEKKITLHIIFKSLIVTTIRKITMSKWQKGTILHVI